MYQKIKFYEKNIFSFEMGETILSKNLTGTGIAVYSSDFNNSAWGITDNNKKKFKKGDIVIGARGTIGSIKLPQEDFFTATQTTMICKILDTNMLSTNFLYYYLTSLNWDKIKSGTTIPMLTIANIKTLEIPLPPLPTQHLIVSEIEKQFSRLDEGLLSLRRAKENLKKYKASVLKSAVEGKLTKDFRKTQKLESASILLEKILEERKKKFLSENPGKKYKEPEGIKQDDLPNIELPEGWEWCNLEQIIISGPQNGLYKPASFYGTGEYSILRIDDYQNGWIKNKDNLRSINLTESEKIIYGLDENDYIINRVNSMTHLGKSIIIPKDLLPCVFESNMMRIKFSNNTNLKFIQFYLYSIHGINSIQKNAKQAVNQASINQEDVKRTLFPLPPLSEQNEIVKIVESKLSVVEKLEKLVDENIKRSENLKQSILKKAFEGELVREE